MSAAFILAGCHATVTLSFNVHPNNTVTVNVREVLDDQLYQLVENQDDGNSDFGVASAQAQGWVASRSVDEDDNHIILMSKTFTMAEFANAFTNGNLPASAGTSIPLDIAAITQTRGLFTDTESLSTTIPAPMPSSQPDAGNPWASAGEAMAASVVSLHLQLKTPGKVVSTNGETLPDGTVQWDLALQSPTAVQYVAQTPDVAHIAWVIVVGIVLLVVGASLGAYAAKRREANVIEEAGEEAVR